ncbi:hypothetical protein HCU64_02830 [Methylobacterium sp. C25]|uniref:hypothetical protein n=1 Tax=Methylobacterium sp. C25 TaxID=2721622 RepID=UPI001F20862A|nr:hypothetical protein [Methylobacterium sp. C25]MCE4222674.1 hypothetical protein [Methylobacterium sp. C25]
MPRTVAFATMQLRRARIERLDAALMAAFTALVIKSQPGRAAPDPRLQPLADRLVAAVRAEPDLAIASTCSSPLASASRPPCGSPC